MKSQKKRTAILVDIFLVLQFLMISLVQGEVHVYDFVLREKNFTRLCETKSMFVVNDIFPGPEIRVHKGDMVYVNVYNQAYYGLTIHWHGIMQLRNPWSDGPEYITQCPIQPGTNFTYEVLLSTEEGTVWWHAHSDWTRASVHGAIVILPTVGSTYPFPQTDEDEVIILSSWYLGDLKVRVDEAMKEATSLPRSDAYTINGQPGDLFPCSKGTAYRLKVDYAKTYLLRIVNANIDSSLFFAVAQHNLTVVGLDGAYIKPIYTTYIVISPGQTMDVLLKTDQVLGRYYMAGRHFSSDNAKVSQFGHDVTAILEYNGDYTYPTSPLFPKTLPMYSDFSAALNFTYQIKSLASPEYPINVPPDNDITTRMFITASMNSLYCEDSGFLSCTEIPIATSVNNISWVNPRNTDLLQAYYRNISGVYSTDFPDQPPTYYNFTDETYSNDTVLTVQGTKVKVLSYNESVEIVFQGTDVQGGSVNHPLHMHGYKFYVVGYGFGNYDNETDPKGFNLVDPPHVTTFGIPKNGWLAIRFIANNPGVWFWHCHMERHLTLGMEAAFIVKNGDTAETSILEPPAYMPSCNVPLASRFKNSDVFVEKKIDQ
ncbi:putative laccase [Rosa chinensis]|uniref:Laccase n=1 Tax=Rosa chinensis TaxID=74649 RepID=A0A2P6PUC4_ROSCH|nr:putative laccase [Rosa chinensis]